MRIASIDSVQRPPEQRCGGCRLCEAVCVLHHEGLANPKRSRIRVFSRIDKSHHLFIDQIVCHQCADEEVPPCADACPDQAIFLDGEAGIWRVDIEECLGCEACRDACPYEAIFIDPVTQTALKCDLCGGEPQCVAICPPEILVLREA